MLVNERVWSAAIYKSRADPNPVVLSTVRKTAKPSSVVSGKAWLKVLASAATTASVRQHDDCRGKLSSVGDFSFVCGFLLISNCCSQHVWMPLLSRDIVRSADDASVPERRHGCAFDKMSPFSANTTDLSPNSRLPTMFFWVAHVRQQPYTHSAVVFYSHWPMLAARYC